MDLYGRLRVVAPGASSPVAFGASGPVAPGASGPVAPGAPSAPPRAAAACAPCGAAPASFGGGQAIGFKAGGAQDAANFRESVAAGLLPLPSDVTFEGLIKVGCLLRRQRVSGCRGGRAEPSGVRALLASLCERARCPSLSLCCQLLPTRPLPSFIPGQDYFFDTATNNEDWVAVER